MSKMIAGIYKIESKVKPTRIYVGSSNNVNERYKSHLRCLRQNNHNNKKLQNHYNKYGESDLVFTLLLKCDLVDLIKIEQYFIDSYNPWFNICKKAGEPSHEKHTDERKKEASKRMKGNTRGFIKGLIPWNKDGKGLQEAWNKGVPFSDETRKKMSESRMGKIPWNKGIKMTEEQKKVNSECHKGIPAWNKGMKMDEPSWNKGKHHTEEHKENLRKAWIKRKLNQETLKITI